MVKSQKAYPPVVLLLLLLLLLTSCMIETDGSPESALDREIVPFLDEFAEVVAIGIEVLGIAVIAKGALTVGYSFARDSIKRTLAIGTCEDCRTHLGHTILLGLEFLVAGDIVRTVAVRPTYQNLGLLAVLVLIRTFLSFTLEIELQGRLPWRTSQRLDWNSSQTQSCSIPPQPRSE